MWYTIAIVCFQIVKLNIVYINYVWFHSSCLIATNAEPKIKLKCCERNALSSFLPPSVACHRCDACARMCVSSHACFSEYYAGKPVITHRCPESTVLCVCIVSLISAMHMQIDWMRLFYHFDECWSDVVHSARKTFATFPSDRFSPDSGQFRWWTKIATIFKSKF